MAYSPELPNIQTFLTPRELLDLVSHELPGFANNAFRRDEISRVLELAGLREYTNIKVGKLSKGMVQRLSVAQALIGSPETLILDEPMIGLILQVPPILGKFLENSLPKAKEQSLCLRIL